LDDSMSDPDRVSPRDRLRPHWHAVAGLVRRLAARCRPVLPARRAPLAPLPFQRRPIFEALEPRLLLSADPIVAPAVDLVFGSATPAAEFRAIDLSPDAPRVTLTAGEAPAAPAAASRELVFVDTATPEYDRLLADLLAGRADGREFEVVLIDRAEDGIARISDALAHHANLDAVHVVSHGEAGAVRLGTATLDLGALDLRRDEIAGWARAFAAAGDLLLYGCDVGGSIDGRALVAGLADLTGADVAASDDPTGAASLGGDWTLEATTGLVEARIAFSTEIESAWTHVLAAEILDWDAGVTINPVGGPVTSYTTGAVNTGTGTVTVTIQGYSHNGTTGSVDPSVFSLLQGGSPSVDQNNTGGLPWPGENALSVTSTGFDADDPLNASDPWNGFLITLDFSHAGGVGNVAFSIFDIDVNGGGGGFIDEIVATSSKGTPTSTTVFTPDGTYPLPATAQVISAGIVRGTGGYNSGSSEPYGNATFQFAQTGINQIRIFYKNAGNPTTQGVSLHDIRFDTGLFANADTATTPENTVLNVTAANGALKNDGDNQPFTGTVAAPVRLNYNAAADTGGNSTWTDDTAVAGYDWQFLNSLGFATNATQSAAVTTRPGITSAYAFGGTLQEAYTTSFDSLPGDPSDADASFELWFKPADIADDDVLFEAGGTGNRGVSIVLDNDNLVFYMRDGAAIASTSANLTTLLGSTAAITGEYIQVVGVYDKDASGTTDALRLYVNGVLVSQNTSQTGLNDWSGNDQVGLAGSTGSLEAPAGPTWTRFEGAIARMRFYESALTAAQVESNYNAVAEGMSVSGVSAAVGGPFTGILPGATGATIALPSGALVTMRADGSYSYNPNGAFNALDVGQTATDTFWYRLTDSAAPSANTAVASVTITITGVGGVPNSPPVVDLDASGAGTGFTTTYTEGATPIAIVDTDVSVTDANTANMTLASITLVNPQVGDELSVVLASLPPGISVAPGSTTSQIFLTGSATKAAYQTALQAVRFATLGDTPATAARAVEIYVSDGLAYSNVATATVNVVAVNDDPVNVGALPPAQVVTEDLAGGLDLSALTLADPDAGAADVLTLRIAASAGTLAATSGGGVVVAGSGTGTITLSGTLANLNAFVDVVGNVGYTGALNVNGNGAATLALAVSDNGNTGTGGGGFVALGAVNVNITPANDAPVASGSATLAAVLEDAAAPAGATIAALFGGNYSDAIDGAQATPLAGIAIVGNAATVAQGTWQYSPDGVAWTGIGTALSNASAVTLPDTHRLRFVPAANFNGIPGALTVRLADGSAGAVAVATGVDVSGAIGGTFRWSAATVALGTSITAVNDAPTLAIGGNQSIAEDAGAQSVAVFASATPGGGADEAGQTLAYVVTNDNNALFSVQPTVSAAGTLTYTAAANAFGSATVTVRSTDNGGVANGGVDTSAAQTFTITVGPVADTPSVTNATTLEDTQTTGGLVISRNAADGAEVTHFKITAIAGGTLYLNDGTTAVANGSFITAAQGIAGLRFTPAPNAIASGSFDVQASTANGDAGLGGGVATATISVTAVNDQPTFTLGPNPISAEDAGAQTVAGFATGIAGGGADEAGQTFAYTISGNTNPGLFSAAPSIAANGTLTYTSAANASGTATITVFVTDSGGTANGGVNVSASQTFTITVGSVADAPSVTVAPAAGSEDTFIPLGVSAALTDLDGSETLAVTVSGVPVGARLADGVNVFDATLGNTTVNVTAWNFAALAVRPPANSDVDFTLTVTATATEAIGGSTATTIANLAVTVNAVADAPSLVVAPGAGNEDTFIALSVSPALVDGDGSETLTLTVSGLPVGARLTDGVNVFDATLGNTTANVTAWNLAALAVRPPANSDVDFSLTVTATAIETIGGSTATTTANLAVTVDAVADAPALVVAAAVGNEDTAIPLSIAPALVDLDGSESVAVVVSAIPVGATLTDGLSSFTATAGNQSTAITGWNLATLTITPPANSDADFTLTVTATATEAIGGSTATTSANLAVTVNAVADAPALVVAPAAGNEDTAIALSIAPALVDIDGSESLSLIVSAIPVGATITDGTSSFTATVGNQSTSITGWSLATLAITPPSNSDADFTLTVAATATEALGGSTASTSANLLVTVNAIADTPALVVAPATGNEDTVIALSIAPALVDADGSETLAVTVAGIPVGAILTDGTSSFTATAGNTTATVSGWNYATLAITPPTNSDADFTLTVTATATEAIGGSTATTSATLAVTVNAVADAPALVVAPAAGNEDTAIALSIAPALLDTDGSEALSLVVSVIPVAATISDGTSSFTATAGNQSTAITGWNLATLAITPPANSDVDFSLVVAATATEALGGATATTTANLAVTVNAVADTPALSVTPAVGNEDAFIPLTVNSALADGDGSESLTVTVSGLPVGARLTDGVNVFDATLGNTTANVSSWNVAALAVRPPANSDVDFTLTVAATAAEAIGGSTATTIANLAVTVNAVADAPALVVAPAAGNEDTAIPLSIAPALLDTDGSETLTLTLTGAPAGATLADGTNSVAIVGPAQVVDITAWNLATLTITPPTNSDADFTLTVAATSTEAIGGGTATTTANLAVTVNAVADAPALVVAPAAGNEDTAIPLSIAPTLLDTDGSEALTLTLTGAPAGATLADGTNSVVIVGPAQVVDITAWNLATLTITPPTNSDADFTLTVAATSTEAIGGGTATTTANLAVTVNAVADAPALVVAPAAGNEDTAIPLSIAPALVDADGSETLTVVVSAIPVGATISDGTSSFTATAGNQSTAVTGWNLATLTITPPANGDADFTLAVAATATEAIGGGTATTAANLAVTVNAVADAPTLVVTPSSGNEDTAIPISISPSLVDTDGSETLSFTLTGAPAGATLADGTNSVVIVGPAQVVDISAWALGSLTITPPPGSDVDFTLSITATATEANGGGTAATTQNLPVTVGAVADTPTLVVGAAAGNEDAPIALSIAPALTDTDGSETLAVSVAGAPVGATLTDGVNTVVIAAVGQVVDVSIWTWGAMTVTAPTDSDADFTLSITATSTETIGGTTASFTANLPVTVNPVADAPALIVAPATGNEDTPIALAIAPTLVDADGSETLTVTLTGAPLGALVTDGANSVVVNAVGQAIDLTGWNFAAIAVTPPADDNTDFTLTVAATATEADGGAAATTSLPIVVTVNPVNDAPIASGSATLAPVAEDAANPPGATVAALFGANYGDATDGAQATALSGVAIVGNAATAAQGTWQYSPDGVTWTSIAAAGLGDANAITLPATYLLRFVPALDYNGTPGALTVRLSDGSTGAVTLAAGVNLAGGIGGTGDWSAATVALGTGIGAVNDAPVIANNGLLVNEGAAAVIAPGALAATDVDNTAAQLAYTLAGLPEHGELLFGGRTLTVGDTFTQADIDSGRVSYRHDGSETTADRFTFTLSDGSGATLGPVTFAIAVNPVNDAPAIVSVALKVDGGRSQLLVAELRATDAESPASSLVWTIGDMAHGRFERVDAPGVPATTFTQADIDAGLIRFVSTDFGRAPTFSATVSDGNLTDGPRTARVTFTAAGAIDESPRPKAEDELGFLRVAGFGGTGDAGGLVSPSAVNFVRHPTVPEFVETVGARPAVAAAAPANKPAGAGDTPQVVVADALLAFDAPQLSTLDGSDMRVEILSSRGVDLGRAFESDLDLDTMRLTGMVLSVGFVWWALRASGLLASLLASAPVWRHVDPLPVLSPTDKGRAVAWTVKRDAEAEREEEGAARVLDGV
jgi:hypothetical protein